MTLFKKSRPKHWLDRLGNVRVEDIVCFTVEAKRHRHWWRGFFKWSLKVGGEHHLYRAVAITKSGSAIPITDWLYEGLYGMDQIAARRAKEIGVPCVYGKRESRIRLVDRDGAVEVRHEWIPRLFEPETEVRLKKVGLLLLMFGVPVMRVLRDIIHDFVG